MSVYTRVTEKRAADAAVAATRRAAVLRRLRWRPEGVTVEGLGTSLAWPSGLGVGAVLRDLAERGEAHERNGVWLLGPDPDPKPQVPLRILPAVNPPPPPAPVADGAPAALREQIGRLVRQRRPEPEPEPKPPKAPKAKPPKPPPAPRVNEKPAQDRIRAMLAEQPGLTLAELATRTGVHPATVRNTIAKMGDLRKEYAPREKGSKGPPPWAYFLPL